MVPGAVGRDHGSVPDTGHPRIRTFHARHGRVTEVMRAALHDLGPRHDLSRRDQARPLVLEVGCGHGQAALAFAAAHPGVDVLAADVHTPGVAHLLLALDDEPLPNVFVARADALDLLDHHLAPGSLTGVHVFFPDPWPKARHRKRRFIRGDVAELLADRLAPGGRLLVATDIEDYARHAREVLDAHPDLVGGPAPRPGWRPTEGYEAKGLAAGRTITDLAYARR
jgi:tRNA (guanine-N7-)-methyltransferase